MLIPDKIRILRSYHLKLNKKEFAEKVGISGSNIGNLESVSQSNARIDTLINIISSFKVNPVWFLTNIYPDDAAYDISIVFMDVDIIRDGLLSYEGNAIKGMKEKLDRCKKNNLLLIQQAENYINIIQASDMYKMMSVVSKDKEDIKKMKDELDG